MGLTPVRRCPLPTRCGHSRNCQPRDALSPEALRKLAVSDRPRAFILHRARRNHRYNAGGWLQPRDDQVADVRLPSLGIGGHAKADDQRIRIGGVHAAPFGGIAKGVERAVGDDLGQAKLAPLAVGRDDDDILAKIAVGQFQLVAGKPVAKPAGPSAFLDILFQ